MGKRNGNISVKKAVLINAIGKYSSVIFQLVFSAFLSRILTPAEFGVVTVINVFVIFFELFSDLGIGTAIIQNRNLDKEDISHIFAFTLYLGVFLAVLFYMLSYGIAEYYNNEIYIPLGAILAFSIMLTSWNVVPNALLMKEKQFTTVAIRTVVACILSYIVAIVMALNGYSYYSLVIRSVVMTVVLLVWNIRASKIRVCLRPNIQSINKIWNYSLYQFGASIINYFQRNLDNLLVGRYLGEEQLGYYNKSYTLMQYPITYLSQVITPVLHPLMAEHQDDKHYIYQQYINIFKTLSTVGVFVCSFFFCASREIILFMFGDQWELAIEPFCIISLSIWPQMLTGTVGCVLQSLNNTKNLFRMCIASLCVSVVGIVAGVTLGELSKLAYCIVIIYYLHFVIYYYVLICIAFRKRFVDFLKAISIDIVCLVILLASAYVIMNIVRHDNVIVVLMIKGVLLTILYISILIVSKRYRLFFEILKKK